jgi:MFS family permease
MVALSFSNALQMGEGAAFSQAIDKFEHAFHITDFTIGVIGYAAGACGASGAVLIGFLCERLRRITVLTAMFAAWTVLMFLAGFLPALILGTTGLLIFVLCRLLTSVTEATDPAVYPLIADYWQVDQRASRIGVFQGLAGFGSLIGLAGAGFMVDRFGWPGAFFMWVPFGLFATYLISRQPEPVRGAQDAAFQSELAALEGREAVRDDEGHGPDETGQRDDDGVEFFDPAGATKWRVIREVLKLKTWRLTAIGLGVAQAMQNAIQYWGIPYLKRSYHLSGEQASVFIVILGPPAAMGVFVGGFAADRLLRRGVVRARVWCSGGAYVAASALCLLAFSTTREVVALSLLGFASFCFAVASGPAFAMLLDVTPFLLRSQATAASDILMFVTGLGTLIVGGLSTLVGNLRIALFLTSPLFLIGGVMLLLVGRTYVRAVEEVVIDAKRQPRGHQAGSPGSLASD